MSKLAGIIRQATRGEGEPLNILTFPTHERYESNLVKTGHNFYGYAGEHIKDWKTMYAPVPDNYILLDGRREDHQIPIDVDFDLVLSQNKFGQFQRAYPLAKGMNIPLVSLEHTLPVPQWDQHRRQSLLDMRGDINVFISDYSINEWGFEKTKDVRVIKHCVDTDMFAFADGPRENRILSVVNDWVGRDWCCGFHSWRRITEGLPVFPVGDTQGLSRPAESTDELVKFYQDSRIFINTSTISPVPTALLEAMACGCAVVTTGTCMIPEIIEHGVNGFMTNDEKEMRDCLTQLLNDPERAKEMGIAASSTIKEKFSKERFVNEWNEVFYEAANITVGIK